MTRDETDALGARLTRAGFGGCAVALVNTKEAASLEKATRRRFNELQFKEPYFYRFHPAVGTQVVNG